MKLTSMLTVVGVVFASAAMAEGDAEKGAKVFRKCQACHQVGDDAKNRVGPVLNGIVDRAAGTIDGFKYSDALLEQAGEGLVWSEENLVAFLAKPRDYLKGTKMAFAGLRKDQEIADVIAYLKTYP